MSAKTREFAERLMDEVWARFDHTSGSAVLSPVALRLPRYRSRGTATVCGEIHIIGPARLGWVHHPLSAAQASTGSLACISTDC